MERSNNTSGRVQMADLKSLRLTCFRNDESSHKDAFYDELKNWLNADRENALKYIDHMENCVTASSSAVLATDYMSWFPSLPYNVRIALMDMSKHYHGEAYLMLNLRQAEWASESSSDVNDLHPEIRHAAKGVKLWSHQGSKYTALIQEFIRCGHGDHKECIGDSNMHYVEHHNQVNLTTRDILLRIKAGFEVRKKAIEWRANIEALVDRWVVQVVECMEKKPSPTKFNATPNDQELYNNVLEELKAWHASYELSLPRSET